MNHLYLFQRETAIYASTTPDHEREDNVKVIHRVTTLCRPERMTLYSTDGERTETGLRVRLLKHLYKKGAFSDIHVNGGMSQEDVIYHRARGAPFTFFFDKADLTFDFYPPPPQTPLLPVDTPPATPPMDGFVPIEYPEVIVSPEALIEPIDDVEEENESCDPVIEISEPVTPVIMSTNPVITPNGSPEASAVVAPIDPPELVIAPMAPPKYRKPRKELSIGERVHLRRSSIASRVVRRRRRQS